MKYFFSEECNSKYLENVFSRYLCSRSNFKATDLKKKSDMQFSQLLIPCENRRTALTHFSSRSHSIIHFFFFFLLSLLSRWSFVILVCVNNCSLSFRISIRRHFHRNPSHSDVSEIILSSLQDPNRFSSSPSH